MNNRFIEVPNKTIKQIRKLNTENMAQVEEEREVKVAFDQRLSGVLHTPHAIDASVDTSEYEKVCGNPGFQYRNSSGKLVDFAVTTQDSQGYIIRCNVYTDTVLYYIGHDCCGRPWFDKVESSAIKLKYNSEAELLVDHLDNTSQSTKYHEVLIR